MNIEKIWLEYKSALKVFLHSKIANEADVEDLLQEIIIKTYNNLATVKKQQSIKSWLFQVANYTIIDFYRKNGGNKGPLPAEPWYLEESLAERDKLYDCVTPFINALPPEHAKLLRAIDIDNKSQKSYAETLDISYSTLKSRVQKSRVLLKQVFDDCCHFERDKLGIVFDYKRKNNGDSQC